MGPCFRYRHQIASDHVAEFLMARSLQSSTSQEHSKMKCSLAYKYANVFHSTRYTTSPLYETKEADDVVYALINTIEYLKKRKKCAQICGHDIINISKGRAIIQMKKCLQHESKSGSGTNKTETSLDV